MSLKTNPLRNAIVIALAASCTTPAFAQSAGDTPTNLDRIEITGSRIRQASVESAQPVVALNRAEIGSARRKLDPQPYETPYNPLSPLSSYAMAAARHMHNAAARIG